MKVAIFTLGCKVNQYESQYLRQLFENGGWQIVSPEEFSDVYIINSCTVTAVGDKKTRQIVHRLKKLNQKSIIVLTGCFPQAFPEDAKKIEEIDIITGTKNRREIYDLVLEKIKGSGSKDQVLKIYNNETDKVFEEMSVEKFEGKTRAFIKIQDGCNRYCSYCIIPKSRGRVRSKPIEDIVTEARKLASNGHKEIVFTGINLPSYGQDLGLSLIDAAEAVASIDLVKRIRFSSLEPELLTEEDIKRLGKIDKFCPHFHLCLQSGCDQTLRRMNRHYTSQEYLDIVNMIRKNIDNAAITTDLMVGFAGETEEEFNKTAEFVKKVGFSKIHVFAYSIRPGTRAALMDGQVSLSEKKRRSNIISKLSDEMQQSFLKDQIGRTLEVLFETRSEDGYYEGYSKNYVNVKVKSEADLCGQIKKVRIIGIESSSCIGEI